MTSKGFARTSFRPGDVITITLQPARNGAPVGALTTAVLPNGQVLYGSKAAKLAAESKQTNP